jgi:polar amino acid transport system substrate-binding protein
VPVDLRTLARLDKERHVLRNLILTLALLGLFNCAFAIELNFVTEEFPPFSYSRGAIANGAFPEIVELTCNTLKWTCPVEVLPWRRALQRAEDGEVDGIFTVIDSPARRNSFHITPMLATSRYNFYTRRENDFIYTNPSDLRGHRVGVYGPSGTSYMLEEQIKGVQNIEVSLITNNRRLLLMLTAGRFGKYGVVVLNNDVAHHLIGHDQLYALRNAGHMSSISYGIGLSRKTVSLDQFQVFNDALVQLINSGQVDKILKRYGLDSAEQSIGLTR